VAYENNPVKYVDPLGLEPIPLSPAGEAQRARMDARARMAEEQRNPKPTIVPNPGYTAKSGVQGATKDQALKWVDEQLNSIFKMGDPKRQEVGKALKSLVEIAYMRDLEQNTSTASRCGLWVYQFNAQTKMNLDLYRQLVELQDNLVVAPQAWQVPPHTTDWRHIAIKVTVKGQKEFTFYFDDGQIGSVTGLGAREIANNTMGVGHIFSEENRAAAFKTNFTVRGAEPVLRTPLPNSRGQDPR
jgi:hypothetical protein